MSNKGKRTPPVRISDAASDNTNQFVYVRRVFLKQTKAQTEQFATTIITERIPRATVDGSAMFVAWFRSRVISRELLNGLSLSSANKQNSR